MIALFFNVLKFEMMFGMTIRILQFSIHIYDKFHMRSFITHSIEYSSSNIHICGLLYFNSINLSQLYNEHNISMQTNRHN